MEFKGNRPCSEVCQVQNPEENCENWIAVTFVFVFSRAVMTQIFEFENCFLGDVQLHLGKAGRYCDDGGEDA